MKRFLFFAVFIVALALVTINLPMVKHAHAEEAKIDVYDQQELVKSVVFKIDVPYYVVNGRTPGVKMDVAPFIRSGRTFVPVRFLGNALGLDDSKITWDNETETATLKGNATLRMTIGQASVSSNGVTRLIDVAPILQSDRTFLPARYVAEGLGYQVAWDEKNNVVVCWPAGQPQPDISAAVDYLNSQVATPTVEAGKTVNGYTIPANTDLNVSTNGYKNSGSIVFNIDLKAGNLQQQYADAESIVSQAVEPATTAKAMNYAKQGQYNDGLLPLKTFNSPNGMAVRVGAGGGYTVQFDLWSTK